MIDSFTLTESQVIIPLCKYNRRQNFNPCAGIFLYTMLHGHLLCIRSILIAYLKVRESTNCHFHNSKLQRIFFFQIGTNITQYLEKRIKNKQPFTLILGDREEQQVIFVVAEKKALQQTSLLKAVDVCFKLFYSLDLHYPWESATNWESFQKVIYSLGEAGETTSPAVNAMRASLNNMV